ncbi:M48 family metalloprotease [Alicyclobacillus ferrooxydans]|uniref:Peptidase M48 domain-containing protein n=1 Tax=Alicyclobacillus ferrooxydans TaxID=471514 RepID=A0A0N8PP62_9BACL|nr:M48 family metalloprotease [Alicyclobacillus ferrooxydans]KPV43437.1 hypothetical protein AN477_12680 [Alicyclobacillus ferrooxydans]
MQHLLRYSYSVAALCITGAFAVALGFVLVSGIRHLLWMHEMGGMHPSDPSLWLLTGGALLMTSLFWYRIMAALFRHRAKRLRFESQITPLLKPLGVEVPESIQGAATWYELDDPQPMAFTWGVLHQRIALSSGLCGALDTPARVAVMHHEAAHARMHDPLQHALLLVLADALGPFGMRALFQHYLVRREVSADRDALAACGGDDLPILSALFTVAAAQQEPASSYVGLAGAIEARLEFLETGTTPHLWDGNLRYRLLASTMAILLTVGQGLLVWCH